MISFYKERFHKLGQKQKDRNNFKGGLGRKMEYTNFCLSFWNVSQLNFELTWEEEADNFLWSPPLFRRNWIRENNIDAKSRRKKADEWSRKLGLGPSPEVRNIEVVESNDRRKGGRPSEVCSAGCIGRSGEFRPGLFVEDSSENTESRSTSFAGIDFENIVGCRSCCCSTLFGLVAPIFRYWRSGWRRWVGRYRRSSRALRRSNRATKSFDSFRWNCRRCN